ncbi:MAG: sugar-binding transcriptional regulator [Clostridium sp.]|nr:sugar-binding transcriptional regulator [Clostridium sp.]
MTDYEKMNEVEKNNFLSEICTLYYENNMTQSEIAQKFSTTRFKISKFLSEAKEKKIVEITIHRTYNHNSNLEIALKERFKLKDALVLDNSSSPSEDTLVCLGEIGARYLNKIIKENLIIGVTWGKTIFNVIKNIQPQKKFPITVVQLLGSAAKNNPLTDTPELIRKLATIYDGKYQFLYAPMYIDNDYARNSLMHEPVINDTLFLASKTDIIITGIGTVDSIFSSSLWSNYLVKNEEKIAKDLGAAGCICGHIYDINGNELDLDLNKKLIGIDLNTLHHTKYTVAIAAGKFKANAILGALNGNHINVLITDSATAEKILYSDKKL